MANEKEQLVIDVIVNNKQALAELDALQEKINKQLKSLGLPEISTKELKSTMDQIDKSNKAQQVAMEKSAKAQQIAMEKSAKAQQAAIENTKKAHAKAFNEMRGEVLSFGLSTLFTNMAIKRTLMNIAQQSMSTYNKLNVNTELANNATNKLNMTLDYLKYIIGESISTALESMLPFLTSVIDSVSEWIEKNPKLIGDLLIWGIVITTVLMAIGQLGLGLLGIISALKLVGIVNAAGIFGGIGGAAVGATGLVSGLLTVLGKLTGIVAIPIGITVTVSFIKKTVEAMEKGDIKNTIWGSIKSILMGAITGGTIGFAIGGPAGAIAGSIIGTITVSVGLIVEAFVARKNYKEQAKKDLEELMKQPKAEFLPGQDKPIVTKKKEDVYKYQAKKGTLTFPETTLDQETLKNIFSPVKTSSLFNTETLDIISANQNIQKELMSKSNENLTLYNNTMSTANTNLSAAVATQNTLLTDTQTNMTNTKNMFGEMSDKEMQDNISYMKKGFYDAGNAGENLSNKFNSILHSLKSKSSDRYGDTIMVG